MKQKILVPVILALSACATTPAHHSRVQVHQANSTIVPTCTKLGPVAGQGSSLDRPSADRAAIQSMKLQAEKLGADSIVIISTSLNFPTVSAQGVALKCY